MTIQAMKQALEALEWVDKYVSCAIGTTIKQRITTLRAAIAEQERAEPVAWSYTSKISGNEVLTHQPPDRVIEPEQFHIQPLFTHPAPVPAGWQLVPVEPTVAMLRAGVAARHESSMTVNPIWKSMLQAAPKPGEMKCE